MAALLNGIRVLDLTRLLPGPYATLRLAEMGAQVIKVEDMNAEDPARHTGPVDASGEGLVFLANHRGKESLKIELRSTAGRQQLLSLVESADVVMESFRPGRMKQFGLGYDVLKQVNPKVVLCSLTGYGQQGPLSQKAGHDLNYMAISGVLSLVAGRREPHPPALQIADMIAGMAASEAVLAALVERDKTGVGRHIDMSMTAALMGLLPVHAAIQSAGIGSYGVEELTGTRVCYGIYETKDAQYMALGALEPKFWQAFCEGTEHPEWIPNQFETADDGNTVYEGVKAQFLKRTQAQWIAFADKVDCCLTPVYELSAALKEAESASLAAVEHDPKAGFTVVSTAAGGVDT